MEPENRQLKLGISLFGLVLGFIAFWSTLNLVKTIGTYGYFFLLFTIPAPIICLYNLIKISKSKITIDKPVFNINLPNLSIISLPTQSLIFPKLYLYEDRLIYDPNRNPRILYELINISPKNLKPIELEYKKINQVKNTGDDIELFIDPNDSIVINYVPKDAIKYIQEKVSS